VRNKMKKIVLRMRERERERKKKGTGGQTRQ
jgi:hypothetical protein